MCNTRIIVCDECGGDGGWVYPVSFDPFTGRIGEQRQECFACEGTGQNEIEVEPIELEDLEP
jgi:hypothetical protein